MRIGFGFSFWMVDPSFPQGLKGKALVPGKKYPTKPEVMAAIPKVCLCEWVGGWEFVCVRVCVRARAESAQFF